MKSYNSVLIYIFRLFVLVFIGWVFDLINYYIYGNIAGQTGEYELTKLRFYSAVFFAPFFETFLFWIIPLILFKKYIQTNYRFLLYFLVSLSWAYLHFYDFSDTISLIFKAFFYWSIFEQSKFSRWRYFLYVSSLHSLNNLIVLITDYGLLDKFDLLFK